MRIIALVAILAMPFLAKAQCVTDSTMPIRGLSIAAPQAKSCDRFVAFIEKELAPRGVNTLILRIDYNYAYKTHPELRNDTTLTEKDVKKIVGACKKNGIKIVPQINLLGHQSWASKEERLLKVYPQFDETPWVKMPEKYDWPNSDGLYCKSYCPLHPDVHKIVFELIDELTEVFEANDFHAGLDEVFYLGEEKCPRCAGRDKAELFAGEVNLIRNHLAQKNRKLWMWGDRLIDGQQTGMGMWEASMNCTHRAIDLIAKDIFICDWHFERPDKTAIYFAMKGFNVATCVWNKHEVSMLQTQDIIKFRKESSPAMQERFKGIVVTFWGSAESMVDNFDKSAEPDREPTKAFLNVFDYVKRLSKP